VEDVDLLELLFSLKVGPVTDRLQLQLAQLIRLSVL